MNHDYLVALGYAAKQHASQVRKGTSNPYIVHPMNVSAIVVDHGGSQTQAIAALLHDVVEDCGGIARLVEIQELFGDDVADIVQLCSDSLDDTDVSEKAEWKLRKLAHLDHLSSKLTSEACMVISADKLHNIRSIVRDYRKMEEDLWDMFKGGKDGTLWYYEQMIEVLKWVDGNELSIPIIAELERNYRELVELSK
jgi:(p)ppGpp synthase/HD superfamily hydrolase